MEPTAPNILVRCTQLVRQLVGGAGVIAPGLDLTNPETGLATALLGDVFQVVTPRPVSTRSP